MHVLSTTRALCRSQDFEGCKQGRGGCCLSPAQWHRCPLTHKHTLVVLWRCCCPLSSASAFLQFLVCLCCGPLLRSGGMTSGASDPADGASHGAATNVVMAIAVALAIGALTRHCLRRMPMVPYTIVLFIWGGIIGLTAAFSPDMHKYTTLTEINPHVFTHVFLPVLIFDSAFSLDVRLLKKVVLDAILLAGPGLMFQIFLIAACTLVFLRGLAWGWAEALLLGAIASATDPVAVVALLKVHPQQCSWSAAAGDRVLWYSQGDRVLHRGVRE